MTDPWPLAGRIWLIGSPGVGKSTLGRSLADLLGHPHLELDHLFWLPGWQRAEETDFTARVATATEAAQWIVDGQYEAAHAILRDRADLVIWLDPPLIVSFGRLIRRTWRRLRHRERLFNGDLETVVGAMELLWWALRQHRAVRGLNTSLQNHIVARGGTFMRVKSAPGLLAEAVMPCDHEIGHQPRSPRSTGARIKCSES